MSPCECGCGETASRRYVSGHNRRGNRSARLIGSGGYIIVHRPDHPRANRLGYVFEHIVIAESALGRPLPEGAVVHHANEDRQDNRPGNLVICPDRAYHNLLHQRIRALDACGNADWVPCAFCKQHDNPDNMMPRGRRFAHRECRNAYHRNYLRRRAEGVAA